MSTNDECPNGIFMPKEEEEFPVTEKYVDRKEIIFSVDDVPPWYLSFFFGLQHYLIIVGSIIGIPSMLIPYFCLSPDHPVKGQIISSTLFASGIVTLMQTVIGVRLPIVQGGAVAFMIPTIAVMTSSYPSCDTYDFANMTESEIDDVWMPRMREIQGAIISSSLVQVVIGFSGLVGFLMRWITPLTIAPTITLVGLGLFKVASDMASEHWGIAILTAFFLTLFIQYLTNVKVPFPTITKKKFTFQFFKPFALFPVILAILISWGVCGILTVTNVLPSNSSARTDTNFDLIKKSQWFYFPYPFQYGIPTFSLSGFLGLLAGVFVSIIDSIGDYYACARLAGASAPPKHAVNRGIGVEGLGNILFGLIGTGNATASFSENIGAIRVTKVGSRRVIQVAALIMILCGMFGKIGAFFGYLPAPVMGGLFLIMFGMLTAVGLSNLQNVDLNSSRNIFVLGICIFFGLSIPEWVSKNAHLIQSGYPELNHVIRVLLSTPMFVGGALGIILDNTIPGTDEERGLTTWNEGVGEGPLQGVGEVPLQGVREVSLQGKRRPEFTSYNLPFGMDFARRRRWCSKIPFSPTYKGI